MRTAIAFGLMVPLLSACGSASQAPAESAAALSAPIQSNAPHQSNASAQSNLPGGIWTGTVRRQEEQLTQQSGGGTTSKTQQTYDATAMIKATPADEGRWTITGTATVAATFSNLWISRQTTPLGPCNQHFTDEAEARGTGAIDGGLEIDDDNFQLLVRLPGVDGTMHSVRDDTGCFGSSTADTNPWPAADRTLGESGRLTDPAVISVIRREPNGNTIVTTTWSLRRTP